MKLDKTMMEFLAGISKQTAEDEYKVQKTPNTPECHFNIRAPLMSMLGLNLKRRTNDYSPKDMIPKKDKESPIMWLNGGQDVAIITHDNRKGLDFKKLSKGHGYKVGDRFTKAGRFEGTVTGIIPGKDVKRRQGEVDVVYDKNYINAKEARHIQLIKAGKAGEIGPSEYEGNLVDYKQVLEQKSSYVVLRAEVNQYLDCEGELSDEPIKSVVHYMSFPKLTPSMDGEPNSLDYQYFVKNNKLIDNKKDELKNKFKAVIKLNALMAAQHRDGLSLVIPNAFFGGLDNGEKTEAKKIFVEAAVEAAKEIRSDSDYLDCGGIFINVGQESDRRMLEKIVADEKAAGIFVNSGDLSAPSRISPQGKFAETIMGEGLGYVGNGAVSKLGNRAVEENLTRRTLGETVLMFSGSLNNKVIDKLLIEERRELKIKQQNESVIKQQSPASTRFMVALAVSMSILTLVCTAQKNEVPVVFLISVVAAGLFICLSKVVDSLSSSLQNIEVKEIENGNKTR